MRPLLPWRVHGQSADGHVSHTDLVVWAVPFGSLHSYTRFLDLAVHLKAISPCQLRPGFKSAWLKGVCIFERASLALFFPFSYIVLFFVLSMTVSLKGYLSITYVFFSYARVWETHKSPTCDVGDLLKDRAVYRDP